MSDRILRDSPNAQLNKTILNRFMSLPLKENVVQATYVYIDKTGKSLRCKDQTLDFIPRNLKEVPFWNYSRVNEPPTNSDMYLRPVAMYKDPFRLGNHIIVMCDTYEYGGKPGPTNFRKSCLDLMNKCEDQGLSLCVEQQYTFLDFDGHPFGWPKCGLPGPHGAFYCGVGANKVYGRDIVEAHFRACLYAGIKIAGTSAEVLPAQWKYEIGPCHDLRIADDLWMSRFLLSRISEEFGIIIEFNSKPVLGTCIESGIKIKFSTAKMRENHGIVNFEKAISKFTSYKNSQRDSRSTNGQQGTVLPNGLTHENNIVCNPRIVNENGKGFFMECNANSECDPYLVVKGILPFVCLNE